MRTSRLSGVGVCAAVILSGCSAITPEPTVVSDSTVVPTPSTTLPKPTASPVGVEDSGTAPVFTCEAVPEAALEVAIRNADQAGFVADGRAAMVRGGLTSHGFSWRVIALGGSPRAGHPEAIGTVLWWGPAVGEPEVEQDGTVRGQFGPMSRAWGGWMGVLFEAEWSVEGQAAAACPLS